MTKVHRDVEKTISRRRESIKRERKKVFRIMLEWFIMVAIAFLLGLAMTKYFFFMINVPSGSMIPTIKVNDKIYVKKIYNKDSLKRGDIVVFIATPDQSLEKEDKHFIKRLIGLPGDKVKLLEGKVLVNGEVLKEEYVKNNELEYRGEFTVPPGSFFFLGDNRASSHDSRFWKDPFVKEEKIIALAGLRVSPLKEMGFLK